MVSSYEICQIFRILDIFYKIWYLTHLNNLLISASIQYPAALATIVNNVPKVPFRKQDWRSQFVISNQMNYQKNST